MKTENNNNQNRPAPSGKTKFLEYSSANPGQHFITVLHGKNVTGRIYREYNSETLTTTYTAKDSKGNLIFSEELSLTGIKKLFVKKAQELTQSLVPEIAKESETPPLPEDLQTYDRTQKLKELRGKDSPEQQNEISR